MHFLPNTSWFVSLIKTDRLMLFRELITVNCESHKIICRVMRVLIFRRVPKMLRKATTNINFVMPVCPLGTVRLPLKEFSCFVAVIFTEISQRN